MLTTHIRQQPPLQLLAGAFMISFSAVFVKLAEVSPTASAFYRVFFGALILLIAALWPRPRKRAEPVHWSLLSFCGLLLFNRPTSSLNWAGVFLTVTAIYLGTRPQRPHS